MNLFQFLAFLASSILSITFIYLKASIQNLQQIIAIVLLILLLLLTRFVFAKSQVNLSKSIQASLLFLTSLIVQLLVLSSGSFYGPLLVLLHIYTLAIAFLLSVGLSLVFLIFSASILVGQIVLDEKIHSLFVSDPSTVILYAVSFLIIIPVGLYLAKTYKIKGTLFSILSEHFHLGQLREESILRGLNELVFVTNNNLQIVSASDAIKSYFNLSSEQIINKPLLETILLKDRNNTTLDSEKLAIREVLVDKAIRIVKDLKLYLPVTRQEMPVVLQIKPIIDSKNMVNQIIFIITDARFYNDSGEYHSSLNQTLIKHQNLLQEIKSKLALTNLPDVKMRIEILDHIEQDLLTALELEDHSITEKISLSDVAYLSNEAVLSKQSFAQSLGVSLQFILPPQDAAAETALFSLRETNLPQQALGGSNYNIPTDSKWLALMLKKLLDIAILLSSDSEKKQITLNIERTNTEVEVNLSVSTSNIPAEKCQNIFTKYYQGLEGVPALYLSSGLEGFIVKQIANRLNIPIEARLITTKELRFIIKLNRNLGLTV